MAIDLKAYKKVNGLKGIYQHNKDDTKWMLSVTLNGKRMRKTFTLRDTPSNMKQQAMLEKAKFIEEKSGITAESGTMKDLFNQWVTSKKSDWSNGTLKKIVSSFKVHIRDEIGSKKVSAVTTMDITYILSRDLSLRVKKSITEVLFPMFEFALDHKIIAVTPIIKTHKVKRDSSAEKKKVTDAPEKYKKVYKAILSLEDPVSRGYMLFGFHGRRKAEALALKWDDILGDSYIIRAENNKVSEDMIYILPTDIKAVLSEIKKEGDFIFNSPKKHGQPISDIRGVVEKVRERSSIPEFGFHWMRNLAVSALFQSGKANIGDLSAMLGHTDLNTLRKYLTIDRETSTARTTAASAELLRGE